MSVKCTILSGKKSGEPTYFHVWKHCFNGEYFLELGDVICRLTQEEVKTLIYHAKNGFEINEEMLDYEG